jgi:hypothetical protein
LTTYEAIKRAGPPQAIQKLREDLYMVQVTLSETPSADWKRLFYETQQSPSPDFLPRVVDISGTALRFRTDAGSVEVKTAWIDRWIERANQKEAAMGGKLDEERRRRREEHQREQQELATVNARWEKL